MYYRVTVKELLSLVICGMALGVAAAFVGTAIGLGRPFATLAGLILAGGVFALIANLTYEIIVNRPSEGPWEPIAPSKTTDEWPVD
jgi:hypothetical protein